MSERRGTRRAVLVGLAAAMLAGCARGRGAATGSGSVGSAGSAGSFASNPFGLFGPRERQAEAAPPAPVDPSRPVPVLLALAADRALGGVVLRARGRTPTQGWYDVRLEPIESARSDELALSFRAVPPLEPSEVGPPRSREVVAAHWLTNARLAGVRRIRVVWGGGSRVLRLR